MVKRERVKWEKRKRKKGTNVKENGPCWLEPTSWHTTRAPLATNTPTGETEKSLASTWPSCGSQPKNSIVSIVHLFPLLLVHLVRLCCCSLLFSTERAHAPWSIYTTYIHLGLPFRNWPNDQPGDGRNYDQWLTVTVTGTLDYYYNNYHNDDDKSHQSERSSWRRWHKPAELCHQLYLPFFSLFYPFMSTVDTKGASHRGYHWMWQPCLATHYESFCIKSCLLFSLEQKVASFAQVWVWISLFIILQWFTWWYSLRWWEVVVCLLFYCLVVHAFEGEKKDEERNCTKWGMFGFMLRLDSLSTIMNLWPPREAEKFFVTSLFLSQRAKRVNSTIVSTGKSSLFMFSKWVSERETFAARSNNNSNNNEHDRSWYLYTMWLMVCSFVF